MIETCQKCRAKERQDAWTLARVCFLAGFMANAMTLLLLYAHKKDGEHLVLKAELGEVASLNFSSVSSWTAFYLVLGILGAIVIAQGMNSLLLWRKLESPHSQSRLGSFLRIVAITCLVSVAYLKLYLLILA